MLPSRSGRSINRSRLRSLSILFLSILLSIAPVFAQTKGSKKGKFVKPRGTPSPGQSLTNIPLPVGHEAKGLVLPDFAADGHLVGKFAAKTARRTDEGHVGFEDLEIVTYTPENQLDLQIAMHTGVLDLNTRILSSNERTFIKRADFNIEGDSVQFDTEKRTSRLVGNVKMVVSSQSQLIQKEDQ
ncbi:MAG TPA: hypothetical protein VIV62_02185 [Chthoniobacterales bacterium]|jgi:hypothetical protein